MPDRSFVMHGSDMVEESVSESSRAAQALRHLPFFFLLATLVFFVPATEAARGVGGLGGGLRARLPTAPEVPANRTTALPGRGPAPTIYDASVAPPPGVALPKVTSAAYAVVERQVRRDDPG